jgi:hypothetical protein
MLSGWRRTSLFVSHCGSFLAARALSVRMPPSMMDCLDHEARFGACVGDQEALTCATWMFSGPNSLFRLWLKLRRANFVTENMLVNVLPLRLAVAPVKISVPLLCAPSFGCLTGSDSSLVLKAVIAALENAKGPTTPVVVELSMSSSVTSKNFLKFPSPALKTATRISDEGK